MLERQFQSDLIKELKEMFHGCIVVKNDANYIQGFPDLLILYRNRWAALECKRSANAMRQPNQVYYIDELDQMSYASFIYPENKEEVLHELQQTFGTRRSARISER
jgi:L-fucose mutarotase/ribose pyranase (RbsD/FucU family)